MSYRNYNSLDRFHDRNDNAEFDDFGFDRRRYGSGRYTRNDFDTISATKHDNPDLVKFSNNVSCAVQQRYEDKCQNANNRTTYASNPRRFRFAFDMCEGF